MPKTQTKKNILFLSYGEDIFQNPILQNQFINFAENFDQEKYNIHIYSFVPISRKRLFANKKWNEEKQNLKDRLHKKNISFQISTLPALASWLYSRAWQILLFHTPWQQIQLALYIWRHQIQFVSARSYHAGFAAIRVRQLFCLKYKVHFDPRGLFVEEGQWHKKIRGLSLWLWNRIQRYIYERADLVSFVSEPFLELQNKKYNIKKSLLMYTHADLSLFKSKTEKQNGPLKFCYSGQLDESGWHPPSYLLKAFSAIQKSCESELLIITQSNKDEILKHVHELHLEKKVQIVSAANREEVAHLLAKCHYAMICYRPLHSQNEKDIALTLVGSKSGEYLAAGLPIICNFELKGIQRIVEKNNLGISYNMGEEQSIPDKLLVLDTNYLSISKRCHTIALDLFDLNKNIHKLSQEVELLCAP